MTSQGPMPASDPRHLPAKHSLLLAGRRISQPLSHELVHSFSVTLPFCCRWVFLHEKAYQVRDTAIESSVVTKVKGFGRYANRVMDVSDYVTPPQVWCPTPRTCACPHLGRTGTKGQVSEPVAAVLLREQEFTLQNAVLDIKKLDFSTPAQPHSHPHPSCLCFGGEQCRKKSRGTTRGYGELILSPAPVPLLARHLGQISQTVASSFVEGKSFPAPQIGTGLFFPSPFFLLRRAPLSLSSSPK